MNRAMAMGVSATGTRSGTAVWLWGALCLIALGRPESRADDCEIDAAAKYQGVESCVSCHSTVDTGLRRSLCRLNEATVSRTTDRHSLSHRILEESEITTRMAGKLGVEAKQLVKTEACLACHVGWTPDWGPVESRKGWLKDGVSCEACHGPSSLYNDPHQKAEWRQLSGCDKTRQGLFDLRDPVRKAEVCLSCHVGDHEQGRFVTHAMYAAGHPPLPSFELATYLEQMPPHWRKLSEKGPLFKSSTEQSPGYVTSREDYLKVNPLVEFEGDLRDLRVGALMTLRASLLLAGGPVAKPGSTPPWADYAQFDCQACHHDLSDPGYRQARYLGQVTRKDPGRVPFGRLRPFEWAERLARVAVADSDRIEFVQAELNRVRGAFVVDPLGQRGLLQQLLHTPGEGVSDKLREWAGELSRQSVTPEVLNQLTAQIYAEATDAEVDYHSARQLVWGLQIIGFERLLGSAVPDGLHTPADLPNDEEVEGTVLKRLETSDLRVFDEFREKVRAPAWDRVRAAFAGVEPNVARRMSARRITDIPADQRKAEDAREDKKLKGILAEAYEADQTEILRSSAEYDPRVFADWIRSLKDQPAGDRADARPAGTFSVGPR
ncbi:MAG: multiheme c-type cytochrome [Planctomycetaceae bacterium]